MVVCDGREDQHAKAQDQRYDVLQSSSELGWSNLFAEVRSYGRGKGRTPAEPETKITGGEPDIDEDL